MRKPIKIVKNEKTGILDVILGGKNVGVFEVVDRGGDYRYFPRRNEIITGNDYLLIGEELNSVNNTGK